MTTNMCAHCEDLKEAGRQTPPHLGLSRVGTTRDIAAYGNRADEQDYICTHCGTEWMHETGNAGYGWIAGESTA